MNRIRIAVVFTIALTCGGGLAYGTYSYLQQVPTRTIEVATLPIVVATANLPLGTELRAEDLTVASWPEAWAPEDAFVSASDLVGRGLIDSVVRGEPILVGKVADPGGRRRSSADYPGGHARGVGAGQRGHRRRRLRAAGHAGRRARDGQSDRQA